MLVNVNLYLKVTSLEKVLKETLDLETKFIQYYDFVLKLVIEAKTNMDRIDHRGTFKADDEVGFSFSAIHTIITNLLAEIKNMKSE